METFGQPLENDFYATVKLLQLGITVRLFKPLEMFICPQSEPHLAVNDKSTCLEMEGKVCLQNERMHVCVHVIFEKYVTINISGKQIKFQYII